MGQFARPCIDCGKLTRTGSRCEVHRARKEAEWDAVKASRKKQTGQYSGDYRRRAKQVRDSAEYCWICGQGARTGDPWQADHIIPGDPNSPLASAHRSCNAARGNRPAF